MQPLVILANWAIGLMFHRDWATAVVGRGDTGQHLRMTTLFSLGNLLKKLPIYYFPGPPDVGAIQGAVAVWSCNSSQKVR